jgi:hypothetical protein
MNVVEFKHFTVMSCKWWERADPILRSRITSHQGRKQIQQKYKCHNFTKYLFLVGNQRGYIQGPDLDHSFTLGAVFWDI